MLFTGIWQKQLLIVKFEKGFFVDQTILSLTLSWSIFCNQWKSKFEAVKNNSKLDKVDRSSIKVNLLIAVDNWTIFSLPWNIWNEHLLMDPMFKPVKTGAMEDSNGSLDWYSLARKTMCRDKHHHIVLWSETGLRSPNSPASKRASSSSMPAWAACGSLGFLWRAREQVNLASLQGLFWIFRTHCSWVC